MNSISKSTPNGKMISLSGHELNPYPFILRVLAFLQIFLISLIALLSMLFSSTFMLYQFTIIS